MSSIRIIPKYIEMKFSEMYSIELFVGKVSSFCLIGNIVIIGNIVGVLVGNMVSTCMWSTSYITDYWPGTT